MTRTEQCPTINTSASSWRIFVSSTLLTMLLVFSLPASAESAQKTRLVRAWFKGHTPIVNRAERYKFAEFELAFFEDIVGTLLEISNEDSLVPSLAKSWSVSDDKLTYTFTLRESYWSNGDRITAQHFVDNVKRTLNDPDARNFYKSIALLKKADEFADGKISDFEQVGIKAVTDDQLIFELSKPSGYFLPKLTSDTFLPAHPLNNEADSTASDSSNSRELLENYLSSGPYKIKAIQDDGFLLEKNTFYWLQEQLGYDEIFYKVVEEQEQLKAVETGEIDIGFSGHSPEFDAFREAHPDKAIIDTSNGTYYYQFNFLSEKMQNPAVRRALNLAFDREKLLDREFPNGEVAAYRFTPPTNQNYPDVELDWTLDSMSDRVARAQQLLQEAGYGQDNPLEVKLITNDVVYHRQATQELARQWKENLGVTLTVDFVSWVELGEERKKERSDYDMFRFGWNELVPDPFYFLRLGHSNTEIGKTGYSSSTFDALLDQAEQTNEQEARYQLLHQAELQYLEDDAIFPIFFYVRRLLVQPHVGGWEIASKRRLVPSKYLYPKP